MPMIGTHRHDFRDGRAIVWWRDKDLEMRSELAVSVNDAVELRRIIVANHGIGQRSVRATSYAEIVLCPRATDAAHPAFNKLFVETDRMRFSGRGRDADYPQALDDDAVLSGTAGAMLDAVAAIRVRFVLEPGAAITFDWITGVAATIDPQNMPRRILCNWQ